MFENFYTEIKKHAEESYPYECCGLIYDGVYHCCKNISADPAGSFVIGDSEIVAGEKYGIDAVVHSHVNGIECPSAADMSGQIEYDAVWVIVNVHNGVAGKPFEFGDKLPIPDLMERNFRHGVTDCYSLIRDWYRLNRDILLKEFPRDWEWWLREEEDIYNLCFEKAGFFKIYEEDLDVGDVVLCSLLGRPKGKINHGGIYLGGGMVLHHLSGSCEYEKRHPRKDLLSRYKKYVKMYLRYGGEK